MNHFNLLCWSPTEETNCANFAVSAIFFIHVVDKYRHHGIPFRTRVIFFHLCPDVANQKQKKEFMVFFLWQSWSGDNIVRLLFSAALV